MGNIRKLDSTVLYCTVKHKLGRSTIAKIGKIAFTAEFELTVANTMRC